MVSRVFAFVIDGVDSIPVTVEADLRPGLPSFSIVGMPDRSVSEARERVRAAISNSGCEFPLRRIVVNLAPAGIRKEGSGLDLAIAGAVLAASGQVAGEPLERTALFGELALDGRLRPCAGALAVAEGARRLGLKAMVAPAQSAFEASLVDGLAVTALSSLGRRGRALPGEGGPPAMRPPSPPRSEPPNLSDVRGHALAIESLVTAAAGGHNLLMVGPPGTGKTMLARRLPGILPPLTREEALEVTRIHGIAGGGPVGGLVDERPFRAPHHSVSAAGLVGGGPVPMPGEATLAHRGVLFLDELSEFNRAALEALRVPVEEGEVTLTRGQRTVRMPTRFALVGATNPCPCGRGVVACRCTEADLARHSRRLSGPLMDRIDIVASVERPASDSLASAPVTTSEKQADRVRDARDRALARSGCANAALPPARLAEARCDEAAVEALRRAYDAGSLSARGRDRALRLARTIADLRASAKVEFDDVAAALAYRHDGDRLAAP